MYRNLSARRKTDGLSAGDSRKKCSAHSQEIARNASSRLLAQLIPSLGGFASIQLARCCTNVRAYTSSPVYQYALPSVLKYWWRLSSQMFLESPTSPESKKRISLQ